MGLSRRQAIIGLGLMAAGSGVNTVAAYSSVESSRGLTLAFSDDASGYLGIAPGLESEYLTYEDGANGLSIRIKGLNNQARTRFDGLIEFTNNGGNTVSELTVSVEDQSQGAQLEILEETISTDLGSGESIVGLDLGIITDHAAAATIEGTITITAETNA